MFQVTRSSVFIVAFKMKDDTWESKAILGWFSRNEEKRNGTEQLSPRISWSSDVFIEPLVLDVGGRGLTTALCYMKHIEAVDYKLQ